MTHRKFTTSRKIFVIVIVLLIAVAGLWAVQREAPLTAADCTSVEKFDPETNECYYECDTDEACERLAKAVEDELNGYFDDAQSRLGNESAPSGQGETTYLNNSGSLDPELPAPDKPVWDLFGKIASVNTRNSIIDQFVLYDNDQDDTAAAVWLSETPNKWNLSVNLAYRDNIKDLVHTLVHEYGHIVSLSSSQVTAVSGSCPRFEVSEGCAKADSYLQAFQQRFWKQYGSNIPKDDGADGDEVAAFYERSGGTETFVSEYAATNTVEDLAESYANFILSAKPNADSERDQKISFFYDYPSLIDERTRIRAAIATELSQRQLLRR